MLNFENSATFLAGKEPSVSLRNFWAPENGFVWSTGKWCEVSFPFDTGARPPFGLADLVMDVDTFKYEDKLRGQNVAVYLNGLRIGSLYCTRRVTSIFQFDAKTLTKTENTITLDTPDSTRPEEFGLRDGRLLGLQLYSLQIRRAD
jgi:hypothetical protein